MAMSYQVLARKYRPRSFQTLVGQEHVVRALTHALEQQRLHHAYLFTGTRGVGKTTLSRILAKALNCETGITATPCGVCEACVAIDAGRFVDYIEMDAASNRGVDEMAQLLEQAVYAPSNARFKVYMIDEVHMLTNHAFNSMLKTLEEPPAHVKFILATTDPQKIPVTVLSRCLQFNLKQMPLPAIVGHLEDILAQEQIGFELPALRLLAQGAQGSMRDALSLTDQAIAYAAGTVSLEAVQAMLGALDQTYLTKILDALAQEDGAGLLAVADQMQARSLSYKAALQDLATMLHQLSIAQLVPAAIADDLPERAELMRLAQLFVPDQIQLFYQIVVHGRHELGLAPDEYAGFSMTLLRMLAFRPVTQQAVGLLEHGPDKATQQPGARPARVAPVAPARPVPAVQAVVSAGRSAPAPAPAADLPAAAPTPAAPVGGRRSPAMAALEALNDRRKPRSTEPLAAPVAAVVAAPPPTMLVTAPASASFSPVKTEIVAVMECAQDVEVMAPSVLPAPALEPAVDLSGLICSTGEPWDGHWPSLAASLALRGVAQQLAQQSELMACRIEFGVIKLQLRVPLETLLTSGSAEKLATSLAEYFTLPVQIGTEIGLVRHTANAAAVMDRAERLVAAEAAVQADPLVQSFIDLFGASIVPGSIAPAG